MPTTRRSTQRQQTPSEQDDSGPSTSSQQAAASGCRRGGGAKSAARGAKRLVCVEEEVLDEKMTEDAMIGTISSTYRLNGAGSAGGDVQKSTSASAHLRNQVDDEHHEEDLSISGADDSSGSEDSDTDEENDEEIFRASMMDNLASSLRAALHARVGARDTSPCPPSTSEPVVCAEKLGLQSDPKTIRWRSERKEPAPTQASQPLEAGKEKGLAKKLLAPPRDSSLQAPSASERSKDWFKLPATKITDEVKQELRLLRLRGAYDPKRFYKSFDETKFPKHFQIGTVLDNPQDFYSSRLAARERGVSITQELLADPAVTAVRKKRYAKLQEKATRYLKVKKRKTGLQRKNAKPKRPKH